MEKLKPLIEAALQSSTSAKVLATKTSDGTLTARKPKPKAETIAKMTPTQLNTLVKSILNGPEFDKKATRVFATLLPELSKSLNNDVEHEIGSPYEWVWSVVGFVDGTFGSVGAPMFKTAQEAEDYIVKELANHSSGYEYFNVVPLSCPPKG
jgi:hypothetical protein